MSAKRLLFAAALLLLQPLTAQENLFIQAPDAEGNLRIEAQALFSQPSSGGYLPVRLNITNKNKTGGRIALHSISSSGGYRSGESKVESDFTIEVEAEKNATHDILLPLFNPTSGSAAEVQLVMSGSYGEARGNLSLWSNEDQPLILLSEPLYTRNASALDSEASSRSSGRSGRENFAGKFDPRSLPEDWRAYSGYDAVALTDSDWTKITPGARTALLQWNRLGGRVVIYIEGGADLKSLGIKADDSTVRSWGAIETLPLPAGGVLEPRSTVSLFYGPHSPGSPRAFHDRINSDYSSGGWPLQIEFGEKSFHYAIFVVVLIIFAILVGPLNLFVFAKSGRRHRLFITTPLIALGASAVLMVMIFLEDGFGGRGFRLSLMEVRPDGGENAAYIQQEQISRTGVLLGSKFDLAGDAMITPLRLRASNWARFTNDDSASRFEIQNAGGKQAIQGDWFQSRSEQGQLIKAVVPTRGRIEGNMTGPVPVLVSTFEFPINTVWFTDATGKLWQADDLHPGQKVTCHAADATSRNSELNRMSFSLRKKSEPLFSRSGFFVATSDQAPGIDTFKNIKWQQTHTILTGPVVAP